MSILNILMRMYNDIQGKIIYDFMQGNICNVISFATADLYLIVNEH